MRKGRLWITVGIAVLAGVGLYQSVILPRQTQAEAVAAADAARAAAARAQEASEAARRATRAGPRGPDAGGPVSR